jgi:hypothetical protein
MAKKHKDNLNLSGLVDQATLKVWLDEAEKDMAVLKKEVSAKRKYLNQLKALKEEDHGETQTDSNAEK